MAVENEYGNPANPLKITWLEGIGNSNVPTTTVETQVDVGLVKYGISSSYGCRINFLALINSYFSLNLHQKIWLRKETLKH